MSVKTTWRLGAWGALLTSSGLVSIGACSSTHDAGTGDAGASTASNSTTAATSSGSSNTSASTGSTTTTSVADAGGVCSFPSPLPTGGLLYSGGTPAPECPSTIAYPGNSWFSYFDSATAGTTDAGAFNFVHTADFNGCDGAGDCAFHAAGMNMPGYGAGVGFTLNNNLVFDASMYTGLQVWFNGTTSGTRGINYSSASNTVHVKFVTELSDGGDPREGDNFGAYCPTLGDGSTGWIVCKLPFAGLTRDGFKGVEAGAPDPKTDVFDPTNLDKIQFEFSSYTPPADSGITQEVSFDLKIDDVAFF